MTSILAKAPDYTVNHICRACEASEGLLDLVSDSNRSLLRKFRACVDVQVPAIRMSFKSNDLNTVI